jgi:hypothetical protein
MPKMFTPTPSSDYLEWFGGHISAAKLLNLHRTTTYRWVVRGIPRTRMRQMQEVARRYGIQIPREDLIAAMGGE